MKNFLTACGPFSASFRFFGVLPREGWGYELDNLHIVVQTYHNGKASAVFTPKVCRI